MKQTDFDTSLNEVIFSGILAFSVMFLSLKDMFSQENQIYFIALIFIYAIAAVLRMFGIVLDSKFFNSSCIHYCRIVLVPYTIWAAVSITFTQIGLSGFGSIFALYILLLSEAFVLKHTYKIRFVFQNPIVIKSNHKRSKH